MSGRRILDTVALLRATKNVAYNHFAIRLSQAQLYGQTSSITKAFAQRYPIVSSLASQQFSQSSFNGKEEGLNQDHHYDRSPEHGRSGLTNEAGIEIKQKEADRYPLPDGTIPPKDSPIGQEKGDAETDNQRRSEQQTPLKESGVTPTISLDSTIPIPTGKPLSSEEAKIAQRISEKQIPAESAEPPKADNDFAVDQEKDIYYQPPGTTSPVLSALPRVKVPKVENDVQAGDKQINADVYYSGADGKAEPTEEQLEQLFHTPRAARLLGKKDKYVPGGKKSFHTSARQSKDMESLGQDLAKDVSYGRLSWTSELTGL